MYENYLLIAQEKKSYNTKVDELLLIAASQKTTIFLLTFFP